MTRHKKQVILCTDTKKQQTQRGREMVNYKWTQENLFSLEARYEKLFLRDYSRKYRFLPNRSEILAEAYLWYPGCQAWTLEIGQKSGIDHEYIAGVMAVLSAQTSVTNNINFTLQAVIEYCATGNVLLEGVAQTPDNCGKALSILQNGDLSQVRGEKISAFADNILHGNESSWHTTDVHMWRALRPTELIGRNTPQPGDFLAIQQVAEKLSLKHGVQIPVLQAHVWCVVRSITYGYYNTSTTLPIVPNFVKSFKHIYDMYVA